LPSWNYMRFNKTLKETYYAPFYKMHYVTLDHKPVSRVIFLLIDI